MRKVKQKSLVDEVEKRNKLRRKKLDELHKKYKSGKLKVTFKKYAKMREEIHNKYGISREWMKKMTKKYYGN